MNQPAFAADITTSHPDTGASIMFHVRGDTADGFITSLRDLQRRVPALQGIIATRSKAEIVEELTGVVATDTGKMRDLAAARVAAERREDPEEAGYGSTAAPAHREDQNMNDDPPICTTHGTAKPTKFGAGLYCPKKEGDAYCSWKHSCDVRCMHRVIAAA